MNERDGVRLMEYLDGTLPPAERESVEAWLAVDSEARQVAAEHRALWALLGSADLPVPAEASAEFRSRTVQRARQEPERVGASGWIPRMVALAAASVLVGLILFAWHDAVQHSTLSEADRMVVGNLDLLEQLDFLKQNGAALDLASGATVARVFPPPRVAAAAQGAPTQGSAGQGSAGAPGAAPAGGPK